MTAVRLERIVELLAPHGLHVHQFLSGRSGAAVVLASRGAPDGPLAVVKVAPRDVIDAEIERYELVGRPEFHSVHEVAVLDHSRLLLDDFLGALVFEIAGGQFRSCRSLRDAVAGDSADLGPVLDALGFATRCIASLPGDEVSGATAVEWLRRRHLQALEELVESARDLQSIDGLRSERWILHPHWQAGELVNPLAWLRPDAEAGQSPEYGLRKLATHTDLHVDNVLVCGGQEQELRAYVVDWGGFESHESEPGYLDLYDAAYLEISLLTHLLPHTDPALFDSPPWLRDEGRLADELVPRLHDPDRVSRAVLSIREAVAASRASVSSEILLYRYQAAAVDAALCLTQRMRESPVSRRCAYFIAASRLTALLRPKRPARGRAVRLLPTSIRTTTSLPRCRVTGELQAVARDSAILGFDEGYKPLDDLTAFFAGRGRGASTLVLYGASGSGKTTLVQRFLESLTAPASLRSGRMQADPLIVCMLDAQAATPEAYVRLILDAIQPFVEGLPPRDREVSDAFAEIAGAFVETGSAGPDVEPDSSIPAAVRFRDAVRRFNHFFPDGQLVLVLDAAEKGSGRGPGAEALGRFAAHARQDGYLLIVTWAVDDGRPDVQAMPEQPEMVQMLPLPAAVAWRLLEGSCDPKRDVADPENYYENLRFATDFRPSHIIGLARRWSKSAGTFSRLCETYRTERNRSDFSAYLGATDLDAPTLSVFIAACAHGQQASPRALAAISRQSDVDAAIETLAGTRLIKLKLEQDRIAWFVPEYLRTITLDCLGAGEEAARQLLRRAGLDPDCGPELIAESYKDAGRWHEQAATASRSRDQSAAHLQSATRYHALGGAHDSAAHCLSQIDDEYLLRRGRAATLIDLSSVLDLDAAVDKHLVAKVLVSRAWAYDYRGDYRRSAGDYERAIELLDRMPPAVLADEPLLLPKALTGLAYARYRGASREDEQGLEVAERAIDRALALLDVMPRNDKVLRLIADNLSNAGLLAQRRGRTEAALLHYRDAAARATELGYAKRLSYVQDNIAILQDRLGLVDEAIEAAGRSLSAALRTDDRRALVFASRSLGNRIRWRDRWGCALGLIWIAINKAYDIGDDFEIANQHDSLAEITRQLGHPRLALMLSKFASGMVIPSSAGDSLHAYVLLTRARALLATQRGGSATATLAGLALPRTLAEVESYLLEAWQLEPDASARIEQLRGIVGGYFTSEPEQRFRYTEAALAGDPLVEARRALIKALAIDEDTEDHRRYRESVCQLAEIDAARGRPEATDSILARLAELIADPVADLGRDGVIQLAVWGCARLRDRKSGAVPRDLARRLITRGLNLLRQEPSEALWALTERVTLDIVVRSLAAVIGHPLEERPVADLAADISSCLRVVSRIEERSEPVPVGLLSTMRARIGQPPAAVGADLSALFDRVARR